ncbi:hypothetical protein UA08_04897 [Talaromyces atroroseus]|uniref:Major facilitator superfamily (MFS) profile domain-containing protein n=1 Tax=Talaromyces atroroseus TaxID=1441469 RepID=A0A225AFQ2_TALAT|nr:hypothetical protein UA08_04897 [Talaromyces atroroseus]OKL60161.1 hypothetical protein UA08_04897 [Talaromyces atroroseus]
MAQSKFASLRTRPLAQNTTASIVLLGTVGIYVAITNLGAGGGKANSLKMNYIVSALNYGIFAIAGFFSGSVINRFGPKWALFLGSLGYPCYVTGLLLFDRFDLLVFPIIGGVLIGFGAALLWAGVNYIAIAAKGRFYAMQTAMTSFGNLIASFLVLGININDEANDGVPLSVYLSFIGIMLVLGFASFILVKPKDVRRKDGTALAVYKEESIITELKNVCRLVFDWKAMALCPALFVAEYLLILQPAISTLYFDLRTRSLLAVISAIVALLSALGMGALLDYKGLSRPLRAKIGFAIVASLTISIYAGEAGWLFSVIPPSQPEDNPAYDWTSSHFPGFFIIYEFFQILGSIGPVYVVWTLASLTNDPKKSAHYAGLIRAVMAAGVSVAFGIAAAGVSERHQFIVHMVLQYCALVPQGVVALTQVTITNYGLEGTVIVPREIAAALGKEDAEYVDVDEVEVEGGKEV